MQLIYVETKIKFMELELILQLDMMDLNLFELN